MAARHRPQYLDEIMEVIVSMKDVKGSTSRRILDRVHSLLELKRKNGKVRSSQIKKALAKGVECGVLIKKDGKYTLGLDAKDYLIYRNWTERYARQTRRACGAKRHRRGKRMRSRSPYTQRERRSSSSYEADDNESDATEGWSHSAMEYNSRTEKMVAAALAIQKENIQTVDPTIEVSQPGTSSEQDYNPTYYESGEDPFSSDDSRADPDFSGSSSSGSPASNNSSPISCSNVARKVLNSSQITKVGKKRLRFPEKWRKNVAKALRNNGKEYVSVSKDGKVRPARTIQPPCGDKCKLQCSKKFTEEDRNLLFTEYWNLGDLQRQRDFLATNMSLVQPKYQYKRDSSHRQQNHAFYFILNNQRIRVCKCFFKATLAINDRPIRTVAQKKLLAPTGQIIEPDKRGRHGKHPKLDAAIKDGVRNHINSIPRVESHYARSNTTKQFIEGGKTIADLHRDYLLLCEEKKIPSVNYNMYSKIFNEEFNLSFFVPKKDQCDYCTAFEQMTTQEKASQLEEYNQHHKEKTLAREEKERDKSSNKHVAVYDLQATLPCPKGETSNFYYISKLNVYNFTIFNLKTKDVECYVWHEGHAHRGADEIGTCVLKYLENLRCNKNISISICVSCGKIITIL
nr:unnamed protein product [Callosobruchus chinensis]